MIFRHSVLRHAGFLLLSAALIACSGSTDTGNENSVNDGSLAGVTTSNDGTGGEQTVEVARDETGNEALRVQGQGFSDWGSSLTIAIPVNSAAGSLGISFRIRGSHAPRFSAATAGVIPAAEGGSCVDACWDAHGADVPSISGEWQTVTFAWADLAQAGWGTPVSFDPGQLQSVSWTISDPGFYDLWIDDLQFVFDASVLQGTGGGTGSGGTTGTGATGSGGGSTGGTSSGGTSATGGTGNGGSGGGITNPENALGKYVTQQMFNQAFPSRNARYKYSALLEAVAKFPAFASCCNDDMKKREVAAFLAHVQHETGHLRYVEETEETRYHGYCQTGQFACPAGSTYWGRGAMQVSWNYNYSFAHDYLNSMGISNNIFNNPSEVAGDDILVWATALWFWVQGDPSYNNPPTSLINSQGFGATIMKINGGLECNGANPAQVQARIDYFKEWCTRLGVDPGPNLSC